MDFEDIKNKLISAHNELIETKMTITGAEAVKIARNLQILREVIAEMDRHDDVE